MKRKKIIKTIWIALIIIIVMIILMLIPIKKEKCPQWLYIDRCIEEDNAAMQWKHNWWYRDLCKKQYEELNQCEKLINKIILKKNCQCTHEDHTWYYKSIITIILEKFKII